MRRSRRQERGQAVVELAITSVMFVVVLLFGIYFAEVGFLSQKVQEAAAYATFDTTSRRVADFDDANLTGKFNAVYKPFSSLNGYKGSAVAAKDRYKDFDGALDKPGALQQVMTGAQGMDVTCQPDQQMSFDLPNVSSGRNQLQSVTNYLNNLYRDTGGLRCSSEASVSAVNFPKSFLETDKVLSKEQLFKGAPLRVCGVGRPKNGKCNGSYAILTGSWALDQAAMGSPDSRIDNHSLQDRSGSPWGAKRNPGYRKLVRDLYLRNGDSKQTPGGGMTRAQEMISIGGDYKPSVVLSTPAFNDRRFLMSYAGEEVDFSESLGGTTDADNKTDTVYNTSGVYIPEWSDPSKRKSAIKNLKDRYKDCFLGIGREGCNK